MEMEEVRSGRGELAAEIDASIAEDSLDFLEKVQYKTDLRRRAPPREARSAGPRPWTMVFDNEAERVRGKIREHASLFPGDQEVAGLIGYLADHFLDFDLDVNTWLRACGCPRDARDRFVAALGSLKAYLDERRVAVAAEAIRKTSTPIGNIGRRAGFKIPRTFQRTFERVLGIRPGDLPRPPSGFEEDASAAAANAEDPVYGQRLVATHWRRQVTLGLLDAERAAELRRLLRERYEGLRDVPWSRGLRPFRGTPVLWLLTGGDDEDPPIAFEPTEAAIRLDSDSTPRRLGRLFHEVYRHLAKPNLRLDQILAAAEQNEKSAWRCFAASVGQPPWSYIHDARMEVAAGMLLLTSLPAAKVCRRVGFTSPSTFHRTFQAFAGRRPAEYRRRARRLLERGGPPPWSFADAYYWREAVSGELMVTEAVKLDEYLERLFPGEASRGE